MVWNGKAREFGGTINRRYNQMEKQKETAQDTKKASLINIPQPNLDSSLKIAASGPLEKVDGRDTVEETIHEESEAEDGN